MKNRSFIIRFVSCLVIYSILVLFTFPALSYAQSQQEEWNKAVILFDDGQKRFNVSDFSGAVRQWEAALVILMKLENKKAIGLTTGSLGTAYSILGNYSKAINCYEHALTIANEIGDIQSKGVHLGRIGFTYSAMGNYSKAISYYQRALEIANEMGDQKGKGHLLASLGLANSNLG
jgi:tetratricopeptide (TPR) repeat protein